MTAEATLILLARHGQTEWNAEGRVQGHSDSDLTDLGRAQARALAEAMSAGWLPGGRPTALYSSDLGRARATAEPIAARLGLPVRPEPALREMKFGELEGRRWLEVEDAFPDLSLRLWGDGADPTLRAPGGESRQQMRDRSARALERIATDHPGESVAVVSHGGVIGFFLRAVLGLPMDARPTYRTPNGSIAGFRYESGRFELWAWGLVPPARGP